MEIEQKQDEEKEMVETHTRNPDEHKWRVINAGADCDTPKEEKTTQNGNLSLQSLQNSPKNRSIGPKCTKISL